MAMHANIDGEFLTQRWTHHMPFMLSSYPETAVKCKPAELKLQNCSLASNLIIIYTLLKLQVSTYTLRKLFKILF